MQKKLVRDKIPEIIKKSGRVPKIHILDKKEHFQQLKIKLQEEVDEFLEEQSLEELADILEVIYALSHEIGHDIDELERVRSKKKSQRGSFDKRIFLEFVK